RFLSTDPVVTDADTGKSFNRYTYALNNPYKFVDPDGRNPAAIPAGVGGTFVCGPVCGGIAAGAVLIGGTYAGKKIVNWWSSRSDPKRSDSNEAPKGNGKNDTKSGSSSDNSNPYKGPVTEPVVVVDQHGNAIPVDQGQSVNTSPNGDFQQVIGTDGTPTGDRMDRGGHPRQPDPSAQKPHGHRPGVTRPDGNPHLPIEPKAQ
ncbi:RHS repeat protein, partial [Undibacterium sp. B2R-29]|nr:RHS repeat protein [Undibacterium crateris]